MTQTSEVAEMFPMHPPAYFQVRDTQGHLHLVNRWMIARVEIQGVEEYLFQVWEHGQSRLNETGINPAHLQVEIIIPAAGPVLLAGHEALTFLRRFYQRNDFIEPVQE
jgi:hypothetical protein